MTTEVSIAPNTHPPCARAPLPGRVRQYRREGEFVAAPSADCRRERRVYTESGGLIVAIHSADFAGRSCWHRRAFLKLVGCQRSRQLRGDAKLLFTGVV